MVNSGVLSEDRANSGVWGDLGQQLRAYQLCLDESALKSDVSLLTGFRISWFSSGWLRNSCFGGETIIYYYVWMALECTSNSITLHYNYTITHPYGFQRIWDPCRFWTFRIIICLCQKGNCTLKIVQFEKTMILLAIFVCMYNTMGAEM